MEYAVICAVAFAASVLTFFSGFGLGTLLLPAFLLFYDPVSAVALTAVVHLLNNLFKLSLLYTNAAMRVVVRFGVPAIAAAFVGAWLLSGLSHFEPMGSYTLFNKTILLHPVQLTLGVLIVAFALFEILPAAQRISVPARYLPAGGLLSGFFGGLSGHQGAFRSVFLLRAGLTKESFIATGTLIACLIDVARIPVYGAEIGAAVGNGTVLLLTAAALSAFAGALLGAKLLHAATMKGIRVMVSILLFAIGVLTAAGVLG